MKKHIRQALVIMAMVLVTVAPVFAGAAVVGSVAGTMNATIDGQALVPKTTIFSGDSLQVGDGAAVVAVGSGSRLVFGRETTASFLRDGSEVTILLGQGHVSVYQAQAGVSLRVKVGTVTVAPTGEYKTLGEVAMVNGAVRITAKEGKLRVEDNGAAQEVVKGKSVVIPASATRPARAPQAGAGSGAAGISASTALNVGSIAAGVTSSVMSGVAISRAGDARDAATDAGNKADAAADAAQDAEAAADAAGDAANAAGCALNEATNTSAYVPPSGQTCP
jgi:hypothetical protein